MPGLNGIQPNEFRFSLIVRGIDTYVLPNAPAGWDDQLIKWGRSMEFFGMIRSYTIPLRFVLDGAWILRTEFYNYGMAANVVLRIESMNNSTWAYSTIFEGDIDFGKTFKDEENQVIANVMEGGISKAISAYKNVKYEIDIDSVTIGSGDKVKMLIPPVALAETAEFIFLAPLDSDAKADAFTGIELVTNEVKSSQISAQSVEFEQNSSPNFATSGKWFFKANVDTSLVITDGRIAGTAVVPISVGTKTLKISLIKNNGVVLATLYTVTMANNAVTFDVPFSANIAMLFDEKVFVYIEIVGGTAGGTGIIISEGLMKLSYTTVTEPTYCYGLRPKYVFDQLIKKMNNDVDFPTQSFDLIERKQLAITCGDAIRQIPEAKIKTSFADFFTSLDANRESGFGIENGKAVFETFSYWFKSNLLAADVGNVKDFNLELYEPLLYSSLRVGYPDQNYDELNGRQEPNSEQEYTFPIDRIQKELNLLSVYRADPYGIEYLRINMDKKTTTDNSSDNDVFIIKLKPTITSVFFGLIKFWEPEGSEVYTSISGIEAGNTIYNLDLTPKNNLYGHGGFLHSVLDKYDGYDIKFVSGKKNTELSTVDLAGNIVTENADVNISALPDKIFLPYLVTFTTKLPKNTLSLIDNYPTGYIRFTYRGNQYSGFIIEASVDISKNGAREFKLLLTPNNNLVNLVH